MSANIFSDDLLRAVLNPRSDTRALILVNLLPLAGVLFFGWEVGAIMLIYWLENGVVGFYNLVKILLASKGEGSLAVSIFLGLFFSFHYGMFWFVHGVFVIVLFVSPQAGPILDDIGIISIVVLGTFVSHGVSFYTNYYKPEAYMDEIPKKLMGQPYSRVFILHFVIIIGGFLVMSLNSPLYALILLIALKIGLDTALHLKVEVG